ncbi:unnamed protein product [Schistocephalus solidus]|uniref:Uncharacterized protein n=1 Tax=Schistocephalus solidus TaxID=70667 RepID=A0A183SU24_SCHSO|nr:unnamed protein product [Schistocephalus solidus]
MLGFKKHPGRTFTGFHYTTECIVSTALCKGFAKRVIIPTLRTVPPPSAPDAGCDFEVEESQVFSFHTVVPPRSPRLQPPPPSHLVTYLFIIKDGNMLTASYQSIIVVQRSYVL